MALFVVFKILMLQICFFITLTNQCHPNIKFRMETETDGKLPFLGVLLSKQRSSNAAINVMPDGRGTTG